ncbi:hydantoinase B/oxoprolinase [Colletotrichum abscissum]|uniref:Hydantoinase B/oxoprolinase n=1 Tax=Colletotrichum abscissum TaxID=1671311 RepID=A0A9P9XA43_9PEZI|nr:hydantoinase B/oxoprolinase [Colletotrichum abscissum]KAI3543826.1 hydantoinase B/oxoprolinase [Colletotrichum abscissum]KAK1489535.1 hydantoinase B/oxoprolinase [Colletotrichum abscissum]
MGSLGPSRKRIRIAIDRGGTFTDVHAYIPGSDEPEMVFKLLSVDPRNYKDAPTEGIRRVLAHYRGAPVSRDEPLDISDVESVRMGTTVATNALLERQGERVAFLTTKGFRDLLVIGNQARPHIFDLSIHKLQNLYEKVVEVEERVTMEEFLENPEKQPIDVESDPELVKGLTGEPVRVLQKPDLGVVASHLRDLKAEGFKSVAICFIHSYLYPDHENEIAELARSMGFDVSVSSELQPTIKMVSRGNSANADAYLSPLIRRYVRDFGSGFKGGLDAIASKLLFMQSDGGLCLWQNFSGLRAILSGPAGGVIGFGKSCYDPETKMPVIGFDMGGTSTDVSRFSGTYDHVFETETAEVTLQTPQLDINTVAAGGGSILHWKNGLFAIGPDSAGAHPGPVCYRKGGPLTVTDANLFLGRLRPEYFPSIFGPKENSPLDYGAAAAAFHTLTEKINSEEGKSFTPEEVASGFLRVANESMSRPIRSLTEGRGIRTSDHVLATFGGAGGQHACDVAEALGVERVVIHRLSSILSAYGMALADLTHEIQRPKAAELSDLSDKQLTEEFKILMDEATATLVVQGFSDEQIEHELFLNLRYKGTNSSLMIRKPEGSWNFTRQFVEHHEEEFGFVLNRDILVEDIRVRALGKTPDSNVTSVSQALKSVETRLVESSKKASTTKLYTSGKWHEVDLFKLEDLAPGERVVGPAIILDQTQTIMIQPSWIATVLPRHLLLDKESTSLGSVSGAVKLSAETDEVDPIQLSVFGHRFMSIAEQMGRSLQMTSVSVNIKERLDYSCAIFSPTGGLVANAPHIPCHLGAMSYAVAYQAERWGNSLRPGDVLVSNHPAAGGSHLPDVTVISPVIDEDTNEVLFWTASRAHHADIGGISAGSMPPHSKEIWQEGASFLSFKLVDGGRFDEEGLAEIMLKKPASYPGSSGTRTWNDNVSDLKAQIAANQKGIRLIQDSIKEYGLPTVQKYMLGIQNNAEKVVRNLLRQVHDQFDGLPLEAEDQMDDGSKLKLKIRINREEGSAVFDFTGTSREMYGNLNAPRAITFSAIIYVLRSLVKEDIPLNQGCLAPINVIIPSGTIISPSLGAATVGGNVETSQRVTDVVLRAFQAAAASQGTCNNLTFGYGGEMVDGKAKPGFGYYETIAGGAGAGPSWEGQSGVHVHMTNTRITDPESLERRYPCILREFGIRRGSGGRGKYNGGDGCIREIEFRRDLHVSVLSERRTVPPYGLAGGEPGALGENVWVRHDEYGTREINLGGKNSCEMKRGDRIIIRSPGGGAYGAL